LTKKDIKLSKIYNFDRTTSEMVLEALPFLEENQYIIGITSKGDVKKYHKGDKIPKGLVFDDTQILDPDTKEIGLIYQPYDIIDLNDKRWEFVSPNIIKLINL